MTTLGGYKLTGCAFYKMHRSKVAKLAKSLKWNIQVSTNSKGNYIDSYNKVKSKSYSVTLQKYNKHIKAIPVRGYYS